MDNPDVVSGLITKSLETNQIIMVVVPGMTYNESVLDITRLLSKESLAYITINKTKQALDERFKREGIKVSNIVYVDAISQTIKETPDQEDRCYYVSSPGNLTEISLSISKMLNHNFTYLIFDSLTNLLVYEQKVSVARFIHTIINKIRGSKTKAIFLVLDTDDKQGIVQETGMFVDKVVSLK